jgi:hypothetical protein
MRSTPDSNQLFVGMTPMVDRCLPPYGEHLLPSCDMLRHKVVFRGLEYGAATYYDAPTPGRCDRRAIIWANQPLAARISAMSATLDSTDSYEDDPEAYERRVRMQFADAAPELMAAMAYAKASDAVIVEVHGLPLSGQIPDTPLDGMVNEHSVRAEVSNLVGAVASGWGLSGFAYRSENDSKLLRAVCPRKQYASAASSQGYERDLVWHQDNANRAIPWVPDHHPAKRGPMNPFQAFVAIRPRSPPMELAALADIIDEAVGRFGPGLVEQLMRNDFAVNKPDSHGGGRDVEGVPLLVRDDDGLWHSRFHAVNVVGLTAVTQRALQLFTGVLVATRNRIGLEARPGTLLLYSNTRCIHGRRKIAAALDGNDRYYVRLYLMPSDMLSRHESHIVNGRIFS